MKFADFYEKGYPVISFELFPPRNTTTMAELEERLPKLIALKPSFITVTYGALGSTQERTLEIASLIKNEYGIDLSSCLFDYTDLLKEINNLEHQKIIIRNLKIKNLKKEIF